MRALRLAVLRLVEAGSRFRMGRAGAGASSEDVADDADLVEAVCGPLGPAGFGQKGDIGLDLLTLGGFGYLVAEFGNLVFGAQPCARGPASPQLGAPDSE